MDMEVKISFVDKLKCKNKKCLGLIKEGKDDTYIIYIDRDQPLFEMIVTFIHEVTHLAVSAFFKNGVCKIEKEEKLCADMEKAAKKSFKKFIQE